MKENEQHRDLIAEARPLVPENDEVEAQAHSRASSLLRAEIVRAGEQRMPFSSRRLVLRGALAFALVAVVTLIGLDLGLPGHTGKTEKLV